MFKDKNIPLHMERLVEMSGIERKSTNVTKREAVAKADGIIFDLHLGKVATGLRITSGTDPQIIEKQMMDVLPRSQ